MYPLFVVLGHISLLFAGLGASVPLEPKYEVVERLTSPPDGWMAVQPAPPSKLMKFRLATYQERAGEFEQKVVDLSTPGHQSYGNHLAIRDIQEFLRPSDRVSGKLLSWLESEYVPSESIENHGNWITFTVPISQAESILKTRFYEFHHEDSGQVTTRTLEYSVPEEVHPYVHLIQPTTRFGRFRSEAEKVHLQPTTATGEDLTANCSSTINPGCLRELYRIHDGNPRPDPRNRLGISGFLEEYARYSDFQEFMKTYGPGQADANFTVISINGGLNLQNSSTPSSEASLDIQYAASMAYDALMTFYTTAGRGPGGPETDQPSAGSSDNEPYLEQLHYLLNLPDEELPAVLSTSYGEDEQSLPESYTNATCSLFAQLGARGVSVIFSSGDSGPGDPCRTNDGRDSPRFQPAFPASCPFVTSVGGTYGIDPERAIDFSGGGFSERFPRPLYQKASVDNYLEKLGNRWDGLFNRGGRGIPDVSAQAQNFLIVDHGSIGKIGGTSASAPVFAGIISRLNAVRLKHNKSRLGFLNPWLYSLHGGFSDIVEGGSVGCGSPQGQIPHAGWNATAGWDAVTGLGTPLYDVLSAMTSNL
ncbi:polynucleotide 3'-phosphatase [Aspergillus nanangensis]|uniref:tripeptidyl-peptidase II n=1 Tax=Aspergillus nanangensis TaxID=2582783 RepID=A0AAD4CUZ4_ASPNN|nr:polynucleotide 3'-phosphatase [Aspergillus nanangensis]